MDTNSFSYTGGEILMPEVFGARIGKSQRWVILHTRPNVEDPIPHLKFGRVARYVWGSPELDAWLARRRA